MQEKYRKRAIELLEAWRYYDEDGIEVINISEAFKIATQLAEEVEKDHKDNYIELLTESNLVLKHLNTLIGISYTKQQVEELLEKQRELCAKEVIIDCEEIDWDRWEHKVDKESILNAKLEI